MSPVAHAGLGLLGWQIFDRRKTVWTLALFVLVSNGLDVDFLLHAIFGNHALFIHQYFTHNLFFTLALSAGACFLLRDARSRVGLILTGLSHLAVDLIVIDTLPPVGIRVFYPLSGIFYNLPWFPFLKRGTWEVMASRRNLEVLALEFGFFVLPVLLVFFRPLWKRMKSAEFWRAEDGGLKRAAEQPGRQGDDGLEQVENGIDGDPQKLEGKKKEPDKGIEDEGEESQRPAEDQ